jgi:hypothetical protein
MVASASVVAAAAGSSTSPSAIAVIRPARVSEKRLVGHVLSSICGPAPAAGARRQARISTSARLAATAGSDAGSNPLGASGPSGVQSARAAGAHTSAMSTTSAPAATRTRFTGACYARRPDGWHRK